MPSAGFLESFSLQAYHPSDMPDCLLTTRLRLPRRAIAVVWAAIAVSPAPTLAQPAAVLARGDSEPVTRQAHGTEHSVGKLQPGEMFRDCDNCPQMLVIPAGSFQMGSPDAEPGCDDDEGPLHRVTIRIPFALAKTEITRAQFGLFVAATGYATGDECDDSRAERFRRNWRNPGYAQELDHPVSCINWDDARAYVDWLAKRTGKPYRLPSEAEWEYAARAGTTGDRFWGDSADLACAYANVADRTAKRQLSAAADWTIHDCTDGHAYSAPVASFRPNAFGLYDMIGNVAEWTEDCSNDGYEGAPNDGSAWTAGDCDRRMLRGGSWSDGPRSARAANRVRVVRKVRNALIIGFRPAIALPRTGADASKVERLP